MNDLISREAVCDYIAEFVNHEYSTDAECEMVEHMVDGIQHLPSIQPKKGEQDICNILDELAATYKARAEAQFGKKIRRNTMIFQTIKEFKKKYRGISIQPQMGHWIDNKVKPRFCNCSECGALSKTYFDYCPHCGAKMMGENIDEFT